MHPATWLAAGASRCGWGGTADGHRGPPPERHLPIALIIRHGVVAVITLLLVLLTAQNAAAG